MTGNGKHTTYKNGDDWGNGLWHGFTHIMIYIYMYMLIIFDHPKDI